MAGHWLTSEDANWDLERSAFNLVIDQRPAGIATPQSADEVSEVVRSAAADGKRIAAQRTGHLAAPLSSLTGTVLLHTAGLGGVQPTATGWWRRCASSAVASWTQWRFSHRRGSLSCTWIRPTPCRTGPTPC